MNKDLPLKDFRVLTDILMQYRNIVLSSEKIFLYCLGKMDTKIQGIEKNGKNIQDIIDKRELYCNVTYDELKEILGCERVKRDVLRRFEDEFKKNCSIKLNNSDDAYDVIFILNKLKFFPSERRIEVHFHENVKVIFDCLKEMSYQKITTEDLKNLKTKYQIKLFLYAKTIYRNNKNCGINVSIEKLKTILNENGNIADYNFISRFINKPSQEINSNNNLSLKIDAKRKGNNINFHVTKKKIGEV